MATLDEKVVEKKRVALHDVINTMEKFYLVEGHQYLGGADHMSIADVWAACEMGQALSVGFDLRSTHPKVAEWYDRVKGAFPEYEKLNKGVKELGATYKPTK